jgi:hypothetical protein
MEDMRGNQTIYRKSDRFIVPKKPVKAEGGKGPARIGSSSEDECRQELNHTDTGTAWNKAKCRRKGKQRQGAESGERNQHGYAESNPQEDGRQESCRR